MSDKFVHWFRSVAPYIHLHRGKTFVIACSGALFASDRFVDLAYDLGLLSGLGIKMVLVHGARTQIDEALAKEGIQTAYHRGIRVTHHKALSAVKKAIGALKIDIEARLSIGLMHLPMHNAALSVVSGNYLMAQPIGVVDGVDFGYSGKVRKVNTEALLSAFENNQLALVSPIGYSPSGEVFNLHYEEVAAKVALALQADKLIYLAPDTLINMLATEGEYTVTQLIHYLEKLPEDEHHANISQMLSYIVTACQGGIERTHIVGMQQTGNLLRELFTHKGVGLMITKDSAETIRQASLSDIAGILRIIEPMEQQGILVRRDRQQLEREIQQFSVIEHDHRILGCMAIFPVENNVAELACFAVHPNHRGDGYATKMLAYAIRQAQKNQIQKLFVLTTQTAHWFLEHGFVYAGVDELPSSKRTLYNWQRASKVLLYDLGKTELEI